MHATALLLAVSAVAVSALPAGFAQQAYSDGTHNDNVTNSSPSGGVNVSLDIVPDYSASRTDFDFQSINLALNQEWIELDLFQYGLERFSAAEFEAFGIGQQERFLIEFFADQEKGHARLLTNMLGDGRAAQQCTYDYGAAGGFSDVSGYIRFCQQLTRWGESGVYGFLGHLADQSAATLLLSSIVTEARQQFGFRQLQGLRPTTEYHAWAWTLLQPYLKSCPANNPKIQFPIFPRLNVSSPDLSQDVTGFNASVGGTNLTAPPAPAGTKITLAWDAPGKVTSYNASQSLYKTSVQDGIGKPSHLAFVSQLNLTYVPLFDVTNNSATAYVPDFTKLWPDVGGKLGELTNSNQSVLAGTIFVAVTDSATYFTPYNLTGINAHVIAGPAIYQFD